MSAVSHKSRLYSCSTFHIRQIKTHARMRSLHILLCCLSLAIAVDFTVKTVSDDWELQSKFFNDPWANAPGGVGQGWTAADGFFTYDYNSTHSLMSFFDTSYGIINVTDKSHPIRQNSPMGFSHSSYMTTEMIDGKPKGNKPNHTPGSWMKPFTYAPNGNDWLWSGGGFVYGGKFYSMQHHCFFKDGGEWCDHAYILVISNPFENDMQKWTSEKNYQLPLTWDHIHHDENYVYLRGTTNSTVRIARYTLSDFVNYNFGNLYCWVKPGTWSRSCDSEANFQPLYSMYVLSNLMNTVWNPYLQKWVSTQATICSLQLRTADKMTGPWTETKTFWEIQKPFTDWVYCYQAASHDAFVSSANADQMMFTTNSMSLQSTSPDFKIDGNGNTRYIMLPFPVRATLKRSDDTAKSARTNSLGPIRFGYDLPGADIASTTVSNVYDCQMKCQGNSNCNAWAYDNNNEGSNSCWLKSVKAGAYQKRGYRTSGVLNRFSSGNFKLYNRGYPVVVSSDNSLKTAATGTTASVFKGNVNADGTFSIVYNGSYVWARYGVATLEAVSLNFGGWETFYLERQTDNSFTLFSDAAQQYVKVQGQVGGSLWPNGGTVADAACFFTIQMV
ncbi:hypothetical protein PROFUN_08242 [Planoprotostelium fungivorum]|uniref:Apple domain-containing protein n=1 Tax=Planoprotostelium fungivorum TaxID=1890364 RepID=A0A2P6NK96_9EUKA|nr:hypothetical protein PROFUN_08242 [Planoprotostelium fungivorum]